MGKKKNSGSRKASSLGRFMAELRSELAERAPKVTFRENPGEKMSEVMLEFIEPYREYATNADEFERLVATAALAWNAALTQGAEREELLRDALKAIAPEDDQEAQELFYGVVRELIDRKEAHFEYDRRLIVSYRITGKPGRMSLLVASALE